MNSSIGRLKSTVHLYRDTFMTLSACALGEIALRQRNFAEALARFRHARRIMKETPRVAGSVRLLCRADAGLAAAYAGQGDRDRAATLADDVRARVLQIARDLGTVTFECSLSHLHLAVAAADVLLGNAERAAYSIDSAHRAGWCDGQWRAADPLFSQLLPHPMVRRVIDALAADPRSSGAFPELEGMAGAPPSP